MKKIVKIILFIVFMIPGVAKADMGAPEVKPYEMVVIAPEGIDYYDFNDKVVGHLDQDERFKVIFEFDSQYNISIDNENSFYLKSINGATLVKEEVDPTYYDEDGYIRKSSGKALIYAKNGVDMLKGPSKVYPKVNKGHIDNGEIVKYSYEIGEGGFIYVEYDGKKGWIDILEGKVLLENNDYYIFKDSYSMSCVTIPKNTILRAKYSTDSWTGKTLFKYKECEGLIPTFKSQDVLKLSGLKATSKKDIKVYEYDNNEGKELTIIPKNTEFIYYASTFSYGEEEDSIYVEYNGIRGWIKASYEDYEIDWDSESDFILEDEEDLDKDDEEIEQKEEKEEKKTSKKKQNASDYVLMYVIIGGTVALAGIIIIILINRNNKLKKQLQNVQEDDKKIEETNVEKISNKEE